jgi:glycosyltransferase involved in cell wall biosynthesis
LEKVVEVFIDAETTARRSGGIGRYTDRLLRELNKSEVISKIYCFGGLSWQEFYEVLENNNLEPQASVSTGLLRKIARNFPGCKSLHQKLVGLFFKAGVKKAAEKQVGVKVNKIYHETNFILKPFDGFKVATIHDLSFIHYPEFQPKSRVRFFRQYFPGTLRKADHLITCTEYIKKELIAEFGISEEKITPIYLGVDEEYKPRFEAETSTILREYGLEHGKYLLSVATLEPRKNLGNVLKSFCALPDELRGSYPLVLVGCEGWMNHDLLSEINVLKEKKEIVLLGYVAEEALPYLYSGARAVIFIPVYEGFGLPALEAMASGVPLLASDIPCLKEVVADGGLYVPVNDISAILFGMTEVLKNDVVREKMIGRGLQRASQFSWQKCGMETLSVYKKLLAEK